MSLYKILRVFIYSLVLVAAFSHAQKTDAQKTDKPLDVIVQTVSMRDLQNNIEALGNLRANESTVITAKVSKVVTAINFEDGQRVQKNSVLVSMANAEEQALMNEARLTSEEAKKQLERVQSLSKSGSISASLLDQSNREYATSRQRFAALEARFNDSLVRAPFSGVVGIRTVSEGTLITPGQTITTLNDDSKMKLDFTVPAIYLRSLRVGLPIEAQSNDLGNKIFKGTIFSLDNQVDEVTRSIRVRALLDNQTHELQQGLLMMVVVRADIRKALVLSEAALVPMGSNNFVFVLRPDKNTNAAPWIAEKRQVYIGQRYKGLVEIEKGLQEGEKVVTHGLQKIRAGQTVNIMAEQSNDPDKKPEPLSELLQQKAKEQAQPKKREGK